MLIVSVDVTADVPVILGEACDKLHVGAAVTPVMVVVTAQVRLTVPVKSPVGVIEIVDVFPEVDPGLTVMFPLLLSTKFEGATVTVPVPWALV